MPTLPYSSFLQSMLYSPSKYRVCCALTFIASSIYPWHQYSISTRHLERLLYVLYRPANTSTSDIRLAATCPTTLLRRQNPLEHFTRYYLFTSNCPTHTLNFNPPQQYPQISTLPLLKVDSDTIYSKQYTIVILIIFNYIRLS